QLATCTRAMPPASSRRASLTIGAHFRKALKEAMRDPLIRTAALLLPLAAACGGNASAPVSPADCRPTVAHQAGSTLAVDIDPAESTIRGLLADGATATAGRPFAIRWVMDSRKAGTEMRMRAIRSEEHTSELQSLAYLVCRL